MEQRDQDVWPGEAVFCPRCGTRLEPSHVHGRQRGVCPACGRIEFRIPSVSVAVVVRDERGHLLMVKRGPGSTQPGLWSIPAGFMDYGEDVRQAAAREVLEETGLIVEVGEPVFVASNFHDPEKLTVGIWFAGTSVGGRLQAGDDAVDAGWFGLDNLPELAFDTDAVLIARLVAAQGQPAG